MKRAILIAATLALLATQAMAGTVYLDKLNPELNNWWNSLDRICRGEPGGSKESDTACNQRAEVDKILEKKGCWNIYPATGQHDTSYWKCRK